MSALALHSAADDNWARQTREKSIGFLSERGNSLVDKVPIRQIAKERGLAVRDLNTIAGRVLVVNSRGAALWIIGHGVIPLRYHQDGSITFPDRDGLASLHYDYYLTYVLPAQQRRAMQQQADDNTTT